MGYSNAIKPIPTPTQESPLRSAVPQARSGTPRNPCSTPLKGGGCSGRTLLFVVQLIAGFQCLSKGASI
jgi:hypothetical protein